MDLAHWQRIRELHERCAELPSREQQLAWLDAQPDDPALIARVRNLLIDTDDPARNAGADKLADLASTLNPPAALPGLQLGAWQLVARIGEGGMGEVWQVQRIEGGFAQRAALKLIRQSLWHAEALRRFDAERQILARLQHPNIATLLDGGCAPGGQPWLVLELVEGNTIVRHCHARHAPLRHRIELFLQVCDAVAHAHRHLIVHRDIKPANVLVTDAGRVKLLDFGVAKLMDAGAEAALTQTAAAPMTPAYAAPEQLRDQPVSTLTDVYALGLLLFELLTGQRARSAATSRAAISAEASTPPDAPSRALSRLTARPEAAAAIQAGFGISARDLGRLLRGDLDAIVTKALREQPPDRYPSVEALADDLRRYLQGHPVQARRGNRRYRLRRFIGRHRLSVALSALLLLALTAGLVRSTTLNHALVRERDRAMAEQQRANAALEFQRELFRQAAPRHHAGRELKASELLDLGERQLEQRSGLNPSVRLSLYEELVTARSGLGDYQHAERLTRQLLHDYQERGDRPGQLRMQIRLGAIETSTGQTPGLPDRIQAIVADPDFSRLARPQQAAALSLRGILLGNDGNFERASDDLQHAARLLEDDGPRSVNWINYRGMAAFWLARAGKLDAMRALLEDTQRQVGDAPMDGIVAQRTLEAAWVSALQMGGAVDEAAQRIPRLLQLTTQMYGSEHPSTAKAYLSAANTEKSRRNLPGARELLLRALDILLASEGEDGHFVRQVHRELGEVQLLSGHLDDAERYLLLASSEEARAQLSESNWFYTRQFLPSVHEAQGRHADAVREVRFLRENAAATWQGSSELSRARMLSLEARYGDQAGQCDAFDAIAQPLENPIARLTVAAYRIACLREHDEQAAADNALAEHDWQPLATRQLDPALREIMKLAGVATE